VPNAACFIHNVTPEHGTIKEARPGTCYLKSSTATPQHGNGGARQISLKHTGKVGGSQPARVARPLPLP